MTDKADHILLIHRDGQIPEKLQEAIAPVEIEKVVCSAEKALEHLVAHEDRVAAVVALDKLDEDEQRKLIELTETLNALSVDIMMLADETVRAPLGANDSIRFIHAREDEPPAQLKGRLLTLLELRPYLKELLTELDYLRRVKQPLSNYFHQVDEELRLAARLQQDFLPRQLPRIEGVRFARVYKPASWVSGDIYDVRRLDEEHIGFYVADVVGHGMPAALLTMFLKQAMVTKRIDGHSYQLPDPAETLAILNREFVAQKLSDFQFATCCYVLMNTRTLEIRVANAGHPYLLRIDTEGRIEELTANGALLGIFEDHEYESETYRLRPGDKLMLYSDGIEAIFDNNHDNEPIQFKDNFADYTHLPIEQMCTRIGESIEVTEGSLHQQDDITIVGVEIET